jgi:hypothetical protein
MTFYDIDSQSLAATLSEMQRQALNKTHGNQIEAVEHIQRWVANDRRFDQFDAGRLVARAEECRTSGATLNLNDNPALLKTRPANRYGQGRVAS